MEESIKILIYVHAFFGGLGLLSGIASIVAKKGSSSHMNMGKLFSFGMLSSSIISIPIAWMPNHMNLFLFLIAMFTIYLVIAGNGSLRFKSKEKADWADLLTSAGMLLFSVIMLGIGFYTMLSNVSSGILYLFFGSFGMFFALADFRFYKKPGKDKNAYLISHIRKMIGAFIASVTAFFVAGLGLMNLVFWILPTILGTIYIVYWRKKVQGKIMIKKA